MKTLKTLSILLLSVLIISCSKKDDGDGGGGAQKPEFNATINGGSFGANYKVELGNYDADSNNGLTIAVTDSNLNIIRVFLNQTGGFGSGIVKEIGNVDGNGFVTNVIIRDQEAMITYNSTQGNIGITENKGNPENEDLRLISGNFTVTATINTGETVTMTGSFKNIAVFGL